MSTEAQVFIVVDPALAWSVEDLARSHAVWVVRTPETEAIARRIWSEQDQGAAQTPQAGITLFDPDVTPEASFMSILEMVDLHHGEDSQDPPVSVIAVHGAHISEPIRGALTALGFTEAVPTEEGFEGRRETA